MSRRQPETGVQSQQAEAPTGATMTDVTPAEAEVGRVVRAAQAEGSITAADLAEQLSVLDLSPDDTDAVYQRLVELGVDVVEDESIREEQEQEDTDEARDRKSVV